MDSWYIMCDITVQVQPSHFDKPLCRIKKNSSTNSNNDVPVQVHAEKRSKGCICITYLVLAVNFLFSKNYATVEKCVLWQGCQKWDWEWHQHEYNCDGYPSTSGLSKKGQVQVLVPETCVKLGIVTYNGIMSLNWRTVTSNPIISKYMDF